MAVVESLCANNLHVYFYDNELNADEIAENGMMNVCYHDDSEIMVGEVSVFANLVKHPKIQGIPPLFS